MCQQKSSQDYSQAQKIHARWQVNQLWQILLLLWIRKTGAGLLLCVIHFGLTDFCWDSVPVFTCTEKPCDVKWETNCKLTLLTYFLSWKSCLFMGQMLISEGFAPHLMKSMKAGFFPGNILLAFLFFLRQINRYSIYTYTWPSVYNRNLKAAYFYFPHLVQIYLK